MARLVYTADSTTTTSADTAPQTMIAILAAEQSSKDSTNANKQPKWSNRGSTGSPVSISDMKSRAVYGFNKYKCSAVSAAFQSPCQASSLAGACA
jgi:hypothetical protein